MKKQLTIMIVTVLFAFVANAQDEFVSKKGIPILPEAGDYSIGINAAPFLTYFGNMLNGTNGNAAPTWGYTAANPMKITGKYMVNANTAYRLMFRLGFTSTNNKNYVMQDGQTTPDPLVTVEDLWKNSQMNVGLGAGIENRRGKGRIQGVYGAMAMLGFETYKDTYTYGNSYSATNMNPNRTNFNGNNLCAAWLLDYKNGTTINFGVLAFVGAEYFFAPKFSLSGEFNYGLEFASTGDGSYSVEEWDAANTVIKTSTVTTGGNSAFGLDTGVGASLNLNFYF